VSNEDAPVIFPGQIFVSQDGNGNAVLLETLIPAGKKKPAIPEQICLSMPIPEEKS
jgi:hypothetical protein